MANARPGACRASSVTVFNAGRLPFQTYTLTTSAVGAQTPLWTDPTDGLQLTVQRGAAQLYDGPIAVSGLDLGISIAPGDVDALTLVVCLPATAGNAMQGQAQTVAITWTASGG